MAKIVLQGTAKEDDVPRLIQIPKTPRLILAGMYN